MDDLADLKSYVYEWTNFAEDYFIAIRLVLEEKLDSNMDSYREVAENSEERF